MCAINPKHKRRLVLDVYTSHNITEDEFNDLVLNAALVAEIRLNQDGRLRWHVKSSDQEAD